MKPPLNLNQFVVSNWIRIALSLWDVVLIWLLIMIALEFGASSWAYFAWLFSGGGLAMMGTVPLWIRIDSLRFQAKQRGVSKRNPLAGIDAIDLLLLAPATLITIATWAAVIAASILIGFDGG